MDYFKLYFLNNLTTSNSFCLIQEEAASIYTMADGSIGDWFGGFLYSAGEQANEAVQDQLSALSFTRFFPTLLPSICIPFPSFIYIIWFVAYSALQFGSYFWGRACD